MIWNRPNCFNYEKCNNAALTIVGDRWVCGECCKKLMAKIKEKNDIIMKEALNDCNRSSDKAKI